MASPLILDYIGFSGQYPFLRSLPPQMSQKGGVTPSTLRDRGDHLAQWLSDAAPPSLLEPPEPLHHAALFLAGIVAPSDPRSLLAERFAQALQHEDYTELFIGDYCGCLVTGGETWFWKTRASTMNIFYQRDGLRLRWSTDPRTLVTEQDLSRDGLAQCCLGEDVFVYPDLAYVAAGTIVRCDASTTQTILFDQLSPALPEDVSELRRKEPTKVCERLPDIALYLGHQHQSLQGIQSLAKQRTLLYKRNRLFHRRTGAKELT